MVIMIMVMIIIIYGLHSVDDDMVLANRVVPFQPVEKLITHVDLDITGLVKL